MYQNKLPNMESDMVLIPNIFQVFSAHSLMPAADMLYCQHNDILYSPQTKSHNPLQTTEHMQHDLQSIRSEGLSSGADK